MDWKRGPPVLVGEKVLWSGNCYNRPESGMIKWIGNIPEISPDWCVGIELDVALPGLGGDGFWKERKLFECRSRHGLLVPIEKIQKLSSKSHHRPMSTENYSHLKLDDSQFRDFAHSHLRYKPQKEINKTQIKNRYFNSESKPIQESFNNQTSDSGLDSKKENRKSAREVLGSINVGRQILQIKNQDVTKSQRDPTETKSSRFSESLFSREYEPQRQSKTLNSLTKDKVNETSKDSQTFDSEACISELIKNMNEVAGFFKEIKEGDESCEKQEAANNVGLYDNTEPSHSKPKKLFSFLKWFNKKHKPEPNLKLLESSAASSPIFPRRESSSCESIDTLFSTQTVRSFAYIPPTQYKPSAPPLYYDKYSYENDCENFSLQKNVPEEADSAFEKRKKRRAPQPPRLSRENSLPTTLERQKNDEDFNGIKTFHRRTVSESFKDKKAGSYCHVQGKRKAPPPPPPAPPLYPNLQKVNNQYPSLYKKKKPAPPPPEFNSESQNQTKKDVHKEKETSRATDESKKEKPTDLKDNGNEQKEERGMKINQTPKDRLTKDASLSPLPSRPWYKRSHRDSTGSNIIRKDLLKGFEKKKNKETDDWMPEVGFSRRSLSTESHSKFNIFSKLEKTEDKKKEEKRKSQISILTNISELDREAAEIVRKEQAEEKKLMAENDAKYYTPKEVREKTEGSSEMSANAMKNFKVSSPVEKRKSRNEKTDANLNSQITDKIIIPEAIVEHASAEEVKPQKDQATVDENLKRKGGILKDKENNLNPDSQSKVNPKNLFSPNVLADLTNSSSRSSPSEISKPNANSSHARLNYFNVQNKELNYLNEPWVCQKCTLENAGWRVFCEICSSMKPAFSSNNTAPKTNTVTSKEPVETESVSPKTTAEKESANEGLVSKASKPNELKFSEGEVKQTSNPTSQFSETEKDMTKVESFDELRKKRMNYFSSKSDTSGSDNVEHDSDYNKMPKKTLTDTREFFPKGEAEEENNTVEADKKHKENNEGQIRKPKEESNTVQIKRKEKESIEEQRNKEKNLLVRENSSTSVVVEERKQERKEEGQQPDKYKDKPETSLAQAEHKKDDADTEKVIEAYIVTKTIVLEDIIVKKPERGRKVSASVQTKSRLSASPETKAMKPPPRTKKIAFGASSQGRGMEPELHSGNYTQKPAKNYKEEDLEELTTKLTHAEGLADFRAKIQTMPLNTEMNTVVVNRLLRKLEAAINCGDHFEAAGLAKELALMKINCSVTRQISASPGTSKITTELYIEDKVSHQGPIALEVSPTMSLLQLKKKIHHEFGIPLEIQRWILGKKLATDDNKTLESEGVKSDCCPLFLYLVAPDNRKTGKESSTTLEKNTETKPDQASQPTEESSDPKPKGWYYNYEEDCYSYCEDSEDDLKSSSTDNNAKSKEITVTEEDMVEMPAATTLRKTELEQGVNIETEKLPIFDLRSRDAENDTEKELKFISVNFVKQKVEKLNKEFAENARAMKPPLRSSRSPETWKCGTCRVVNLPGRSNCLSCNAKKPVTDTKNTKITNANGGQIKTEVVNVQAKAHDNIHYKTLMELQDADLVPNSEPFRCSICLVDYDMGEGVTLKDCLHTFCRTCLVGTVQFSEDAEVKCPYFDEMYSCPSVLQQREIKALVPRGIFELHLAKSVKEAENKIGNAFHCKTPDCRGWCIYEDNVNEFRCPVCKANNCLTCQAVHNGINCREYQERMKDASETDIDAKKTRDMLNEMVEKGEAMACPKCQVVLMKKWGCDWLKCSMCKTEICWVTRGFRWGPEGKGDTSGGCKCGVNGVKCHPKCNYCH